MSRSRTFSGTSCRRAGVSLGLGLLLVFPAGTALAAPEEQPSPEQESSGQLAHVEYSQLSPSPDTGASPALGTTASVPPGENESSDAEEESGSESPSVAPSSPSFELDCPMHNSILQPGETVSISVQTDGDVTEPLTITADSPVAGGDVQVNGTTAVYRAPSPYTSNQDSFTLRATDAVGTTAKCQVRVTLEAVHTESPSPTPSDTPTSSPSPTRTEPTTRTPTATQTATQTVTAPAPTPSVTTRSPWFPGGDSGSNSGGNSGGNASYQGPFAPVPPNQNGDNGTGDDDAEAPTATETATVSVTSVPNSPDPENTGATEDADAQPDASDAEAAGQQDPARMAAPGWLLPVGLIAIVLLIAAGLLAWTSRHRGGGNHR